MTRHIRRDQVLAFIYQNQHVSVTQICDEFAVSEATARRVLNELARDSKVERIRGGAIALQSANGTGARQGFRSRSVEREAEKRRIGKAAAGLVNNGDTVFLGSGTTVLEVAHHLREHQQLTVMTNSVAIIDLLKDDTDIQLIALGGILWHSEQSFIGHITEQALSELHADKVITGIRAIDVDKGLSNRDPMCTQTERAILDVGEQVIVVADHTKCNSVDMAHIAPLTAIDILVTDTDAPSDFVAAVAAHGIQVIQA